MAKSNTKSNTKSNSNSSSTRNTPNRDLDLEARWRRIVREHGRGGLTVREFCRSRDLTETAFYYWRRELARRDDEPTARARARARGPRPSFATVSVVDDVVDATTPRPAGPVGVCPGGPAAIEIV